MQIKEFLRSTPKVENRISNLLEINGKVLELFVDSKQVEYVANKDVEFILVANDTTFYPHSNGQEGDRGLIVSSHSVIKVLNTTTEHNVVLHHCKLLTGCIHVNEHIQLIVDSDWREGINRHHTAAHILYGILRDLFGKNIHRTNLSVNNISGKLECNLSAPLSASDKEAIYKKMKPILEKDDHVFTILMTYDIAKSQNALHVQEKAGQHLVRCMMCPHVLIVSDGTHVENSKDLGKFTILKDVEGAQGSRIIEFTCCF